MSTPPETDEVGRRASESRQLIDEARDRLYAARRSRGFGRHPTIREVSQLLGYHPDTLYRYSSGVPMSAAMAARLRAFCSTTDKVT